MINIQFNIHNPWSERFENIKSFAHSLTENKTLEVQFCKTSDIINLDLNVTHRQSHAGLMIEFGLFGYNLYISICDNRHWDYFNNCWEKYEYTDS